MFYLTKGTSHYRKERNMTYSLVSDAETVATEAHKGIMRPGKIKEPYIVHPKEVAGLVAQSGGSNAEIAAGWLHDVPEDTSVSIKDIQLQFGDTVAEIVDGLTDPPEFSGLPTLVRKTQQAERLKKKGESVKRVKIADSISNLRKIAIDPPTHWDKQRCLNYIEGVRLVATECYGISAFLDGQFDSAYQNAVLVYS
jgi:(p)ppGpp synthase/HD superfamily hydrolase